MITLENGVAVLTSDDKGFTGALLLQPENQRPPRDWQAVLDAITSTVAKKYSITEVEGLYSLTRSPKEGIIITRQPYQNKDNKISSRFIDSLGLLEFSPASPPHYNDFQTVLIVRPEGVEGAWSPLSIGCRVTDYGAVVPEKGLSSLDYSEMKKTADGLLLLLGLQNSLS